MTKLKKLFTLLLTSGLLVSSFVAIPTAFAHHGWGSYQEDIEITLNVKELKFGNPHDRLFVLSQYQRGIAW